MTGLIFLHFSWYTNSFLLRAFRQCCIRFLLENVLLEHILWGKCCVTAEMPFKPGLFFVSGRIAQLGSVGALHVFVLILVEQSLIELLEILNCFVHKKHFIGQSKNNIVTDRRRHLALILFQTLLRKNLNIL